MDAENYGHIVSISALEKSLALLLAALRTMGYLDLFQPLVGMIRVESESDFALWCHKNFRTASFAAVRVRD